MFDILFSHALIVTMDTEARIIRDGYLGVSGKHITYIGVDVPSQPALREIDCRGNILIPGMINTHAHTAMTLLRALEDKCSLNDWLFKHIFPLEAKLDAEAVNCGVALGVAEMLSSGTTSVCDMYYYEDTTMKLVEQIGMRGLFSNAVLSFSPSFVFENDRSYTELLAMVEHIKHSTTGLVRPMAAIHCERTSQPNVRAKMINLAKELGVMMNIHLAETRVDFDECMRETGKTPTEVLNDEGVFDVPCIAAHCCHMTEHDMEILHDKRVSVSHNSVSNLKLASGIAPIADFMRHGVNVSIGTDGCSSNDSLDMFEEMKTATLLAKYRENDPSVMSAFDAMTLATVNGATAMGLDGIVGRLADGYEADIVMIDVHSPHMHPLRDPYRNIVYAARGSDVKLTMVQGQVLYEDGRFTTIDISGVYSKLDNYALPLINS